MKVLCFAVIMFAVCFAADPKKVYEFTADKNKMTVRAQYKEAEKGTKFKEKYEWAVETTGSGFKLENKYFSDDKATKSKFELRSYIKKVVEFVKKDANSTDEKYTDQNVTKTYKLDKWMDATYDPSDCKGEKCTATFKTDDDCLSVIVRSNLEGFQGTGQLNVKADDMKLDIKFGAGCPVEAGNALAVIGRVESSARTKARAASTNNNGIETEKTDGVQGYFTWLGEVDCEGTTKTKRKVIDGGADAAATDGKEVTWTVHKMKGDTSCLWDPVEGLTIDPLSGGLRAGLSALSLFLPLLAWLAH